MASTVMVLSPSEMFTVAEKFPVALSTYAGAPPTRTVAFPPGSVAPVMLTCRSRVKLPSFGEPMVNTGARVSTVKVEGAMLKLLDVSVPLILTTWGPSGRAAANDQLLVPLAEIQLPLSMLPSILATLVSLSQADPEKDTKEVLTNEPGAGCSISIAGPMSSRRSRSSTVPLTHVVLEATSPLLVALTV